MFIDIEWMILYKNYLKKHFYGSSVLTDKGETDDKD
jgi:hypothetical protein